MSPHQIALYFPRISLIFIDVHDKTHIFFPDWPDRNVLPVLQGFVCTSAYLSVSNDDMCRLEQFYAKDPALLGNLLKSVQSRTLNPFS